MFENYQKRFTLTTYGNNSFGLVIGFEQVVTNIIPTYYVLDASKSRVIQYDQFWNYQKYYNLTYPGSFNLKYMNGYFYISANNFFYKTDINFNNTASYYNSYVAYRSIYYDSIYSLFYVATLYAPGVSIFDINCNFQRL